MFLIIIIIIIITIIIIIIIVHPITLSSHVINVIM